MGTGHGILPGKDDKEQVEASSSSTVKIGNNREKSSVLAWFVLSEWNSTGLC
jgi:hypothetical protein